MSGAGPWGQFEGESIVFPEIVPQRMTSQAFMEAIRAHAVAAEEVALWFLGQNGWILKQADGTTVAIDPYLTDGCASGDSGVRNEKSRLLPVFIEPEDLVVDLILFTHSHADHCDPYTLKRLARKDAITFGGPWQCLQVLAEAGIDGSRVHLLHPLERLRFGTLDVTGVFALPTSADELNHIGLLIQFANGKVYYNSGDTAFSELLSHVREFRPDVASICINGGYHNLSHWDAARVMAAIRPKVALPAHFDMMPHNVQPPHMFQKSLREHDPAITYRRLDYYTCMLF